MNGNPSALTTAGIALGGGVVGGVITFVGQWLLDQRWAKREDLRDNRLARGAARLLQQDFRRALLRLREAAVTATWWPAERELSFRVTMDDRRARAARMPTDGWRIIVEAEADFENWNEKRIDAPHLVLGPEAVRSLQHSGDVVEAALTALLSFDSAMSDRFRVRFVKQ